MVPTISIPYPLGNPSSSREKQHLLCRSRVEAALDALATDIEKQTIFKVEIQDAGRYEMRFCIS